MNDKAKMREKLKARAIQIIQKKGFDALKRDELAAEFGIPGGSFTYRCGVSYTDFLQEIVTELGTIDRAGGLVYAHPNIRRAQLLGAAAKLARAGNYQTLKRQDIAQEAGVSPALVNSVFGSLGELKTELMAYACENDVFEIVLQGLAAHDSAAVNAPYDVRIAAVDWLRSQQTA